MTDNAAFIFHNQTLGYDFNDHHPFKQKRLLLTMDLLKQVGALAEQQVVTPRSALDEELLWIHSPHYVDIVKQLSAHTPSEQHLKQAGKYGLDTEDTPYFPRMHEVTSAIVGGSITAAELVMSGSVRHALHLGGGLHHAMPNKGSGFCIYNDASIAIAYIRKHYHKKVLYIDTDVHHGDGVQMSYYSDPDVCTLSIHETGKYLFPGTGAVNERGEGHGFGACFNIPMEPYTEDESWLECFKDVLEQASAHFRPDVIISQHGCDAHSYDPLSHIHCSMDIYAEMPKIIDSLAEQYCEGRWVALGGGGYDIWRVVPRAWSLLWLVMNKHPLVREIDSNPLLPLPQAWREQWQPQAPENLPDTWMDRKNAWEPIPRRREITERNQKNKEIALLYLR